MTISTPINNEQYTANVNRITIINWQDTPSSFRHNLSPIQKYSVLFSQKTLNFDIIM